MADEYRPLEIYLTQKEAARVCGMSEAWFQKQRRIGQGPEYRKFGRAVRYPRSRLESWAEAQGWEVGHGQ